MIKSSGGERNMKPVIAFGAVVVIGGALVAWRWMGSGAEPLDSAAAQRDREIQQAIERGALNQPEQPEPVIEEDPGPPTRAPMRSADPG
ncbi:MAG: hypothetical protein KF902_13555 [Phycisphaeraceae bacterium]|nr:hypothetical protein [Phycisphaeraceae bacterium]MCW5769587.1 hypothetical protein [Phycisphaeraceae bacterium]